MLTITTEKQVIYINTNLLKSRLKKAILTLLKAVTIVCGLYGVFIILQTAGQSDSYEISFLQMVTQILHGVLCFAIAYILSFVKNALQ